MNKLFLLSIVLPEPALLTHISALPSIPCFVFCAVVLPPRMNFLFVPIRESFCESSLSVCLPAFLPISRVDIAQHTSAYTHNCISYSNTPNTGCPVLGVHINLSNRSRCFSNISFLVQIVREHTQQCRHLRISEHRRQCLRRQALR